MKSETRGPRVLFLMLAGGSPEHMRNLYAQQLNCFEDCGENIEYLYMIADTSVIEITRDDHLLLIPVEDKYENMLEKTILALRWCLINLKFDYVIRSNTSNFFYLPELNNSILGTFPEGKLYGGAIGIREMEFDALSETVKYVSGAGIYLDRLAVAELITIQIETYDGVVEDIAIGHFMGRLGYEPMQIERIDITDWVPLRVGFHFRLKAWHDDEITVKRFYEINQVLKASNSKEFKKRLIWFQFKEAVRGLRQRSAEPLKNLIALVFIKQS